MVWKTLPPAAIVGDTKRKRIGFTVYFLLVAGFAAYCIVFLVRQYHKLDNPPTAQSYETSNWEIPDLIACPSWVTEWHAGVCEVSYYQENVENFQCDVSTYFYNITDEGYERCIKFEFGGTYAKNAPAEIHLQLIYTRPFGGFMDMQLTTDDVSYSYLGVGPLNSATSSAGILSFNRYSYKKLRKHPEVVYTLESPSTIVSPYLQIDSSLLSPLQGPGCVDGVIECSGGAFNESAICSGQKDEECVMVFDAFIYVRSMLELQILEVDPFSYDEVLGTLGGFWIWVGAIFGLCFGLKRRPERLYPGILMKLIFCMNDDDEEEEIQKQVEKTIREHKSARAALDAVTKTASMELEPYDSGKEDGRPSIVPDVPASPSVKSSKTE